MFVFIFDRKLEAKLQLEFNLLFKSIILLYFLQFILVAFLELKKRDKNNIKRILYNSNSKN